MNSRTLSHTVILLILLALTACKEVPPGVNFSPNTAADTATISSQKHNVLLEEITGVRCVNCPQGHVIAQEIADAHPGRVFIVAIHAGQYAIPYSFSHYNFEIQQGSDIYNLLGGSVGFPCADINRVGTVGSKLLTPASVWAGYVNAELLDTLPVVKIGLTPTYNSATRQLNLAVQLLYTQNELTPNNLSVIITESGMVDAQEVPINISPSGIDTFYVHRDVLRGMLTPYNGTPVSGNKTPGTPINITLPSYSIPSGWNADSCTIITFVTQGTDSILQVVQTPLKK